MALVAGPSTGAACRSKGVCDWLWQVYGHLLGVLVVLRIVVGYTVRPRIEKRELRSGHKRRNGCIYLLVYILHHHSHLEPYCVSGVVLKFIREGYLFSSCRGPRRALLTFTELDFRYHIDISFELRSRWRKQSSPRSSRPSSAWYVLTVLIVWHSADRCLQGGIAFAVSTLDPAFSNILTLRLPR